MIVHQYYKINSFCVHFLKEHLTLVKFKNDLDYVLLKTAFEDQNKVFHGALI